MKIIKVFIRGVKYIIYISAMFFKKKAAQFQWIKNNSHNKTRMINYFPKNVVSVGNGTYGGLIVHHFLAEGEGLQIGHYCSIGPDVEFFLGGEHHPQYISNYPFALYFKELKNYEQLDRTTKGPIVVDDDVWIGARSIILSGVHIGQGAIIGAGSVVAKDVPPYAVYAGGRIVEYRFDTKTIDLLKKIDYSHISSEDIINNASLFYSDDFLNGLDERNVHN